MVVIIILRRAFLKKLTQKIIVSPDKTGMKNAVIGQKNVNGSDIPPF